jgi:hypothetical protein
MRILSKEITMFEHERKPRSSARLALVAALLNVGAALIRVANELFT